MPAYQVQRSIDIDASPEDVFATVADFGTWSTWSPWLRIEPDATVDVSAVPNQVGSTYRWSGEVVGEGGMEHMELHAPKQVVIDLTFLKPFKSSCGVEFEVNRTSTDGRTRLTWTMNGNVPWFLFFMKSMFETMIGMDYERGLKMIKEYIETGQVASKVEILGIQTLPAITVAGIRDQSPIAEIGPTMAGAFDQVIREFGGESHSETSPDMLSIYHPCSDLKRGIFDFTSGFSVGDSDCELPSGSAEGSGKWESCPVPASSYLGLRHIGRYENLGNAWSGAYQYARYKKMKMKKSPSLEFYRNNPRETAAEELLTEIYLPIKT